MSSVLRDRVTYVAFAVLFVVSGIGAIFAGSPERYTCIAMMLIIGLASIGIAARTSYLVKKISAFAYSAQDRYQLATEFTEDVSRLLRDAHQHLEKHDPNKAVTLAKDMDACSRFHAQALAELKEEK